MRICDELRASVLQAAIQGKLSNTSSSDTKVNEMLEGIAKDRAERIERHETKKDKRIETITPVDNQPFDIPDSWRFVHLGEVLYKLTDGTHKTPKYTNEGVKFVSVKDMSNGVLCLENTKHISEKEHTELFKRCNPELGDIILSKVGTTGIPAIVNTEEPFSLFVSVALLKFSHEYIYNKYLYYLLYSPMVQEQAAENTKGIGNKNWVLDKIANTVIVLPPYEEQKRIVAKVDELMAKIDELERTELELEELHKQFPGDMKAALLQAAMQGKLTEQFSEDGYASDLIELIKSKKTKDGKNVEPIEDADKAYTLPNNWEWVRLENITETEIKRGKSPKYVDNSTVLAFAQKCNTKAGYIDLTLAKCIDEEKASKWDSDVDLRKGDIVINSTGNGTLGRIGYYNEPDVEGRRVIPDSHVTTVRVHSACLNEYILHCLKSMQSELEKLGTGSTNQTELNATTVKNLLIPLPPLAEQKRIVEKLDKLLPLCDKLEELHKEA